MASETSLKFGSCKLLVSHRSRRERTRAVFKLERFQGVGTPRDQIRYQLGIFDRARHLDPGKVETTREVQ